MSAKIFSTRPVDYNLMMAFIIFLLVASIDSYFPDTFNFIGDAVEATLCIFLSTVFIDFYVFMRTILELRPENTFKKL